MSTSTEYAAAAEQNTSLYRFEEVDYLNACAHLGLFLVPVSGDMIATLKRGTHTQILKRRRRARAVTTQAQQVAR